MDKDSAIRHFGTQTAMAAALGCDQSTVSGWGRFPPPLRQLQIEALTNGELRAGPECDKYRVAPKEAA
jgi:DNA-binding transcriptional regulator YdaS (Cro superfamily)